MGLASAAALAGRLEVQEQTTGTAQSQGKTDTPAPLEKIGRDVKAPVLLEAPDAAYPKGETKSGVCVVAVVVNRDGLPEEVHVVKPLGAEFDSSAVTAVKQYRFKPATKAGKPVPVRVHV